MAHKQKPPAASTTCSAKELHRVLDTPNLSPQIFRDFILHKPGAARCFCRHHLSAQAKRRLYLTQMEVLTEQFIDTQLQDKIGNVVLRMPSRPKTRGWSYVILFQCNQPQLLTPPDVDRCLQRIYNMHIHTVADDPVISFHLVLFRTEPGDEPDAIESKDPSRYFTLQPMGYA